jgi:putative membrane protein
MTMVVSHWSANVAVLTVYVLVAVTHLIGVRGEALDAKWQGRSLPPGRLVEAASFQFGLLIALLALVSPIGYWSYRFIWVRNMQDVMLAFGAPAFIVLGAPWLPLRRGLGLGRRGSAGEGAPGSPAAGGWRPGWQAGPILATVVFSVVWWVWHLTGPFDAALRSPALYAVEVVTYLGVGIWFWLQLIGSRPLSPAMTPLNRIALVVAAAASSTVLGLIRVYSAGLTYPAYNNPHHAIFSVVTDQQVGGGVLWVIPLVPFTIAAIALAIGWLQQDESASDTSALDRLLRQRSAWPSRPS